MPSYPISGSSSNSGYSRRDDYKGLTSAIILANHPQHLSNATHIGCLINLSDNMAIIRSFLQTYNHVCSSVSSGSEKSPVVISICKVIVISTSIDVLPSKNQALCEYCKQVKTLLILYLVYFRFNIIM